MGIFCECHTRSPYINSLQGSVGILVGFAFVEPEDIQDLQLHVSSLVDRYDLSIPQIPGLDFARVEAEWTSLRNSIPEIWKFNNDGREFQVGVAMKERGLSAEYPVVLIPGIISTVRSTLSIRRVAKLRQRFCRVWNLGLQNHNTGLSSGRNSGVALICFHK